jgi:hypothetical protein
LCFKLVIETNLYYDARSEKFNKKNINVYKAVRYNQYLNNAAKFRLPLPKTKETASCRSHVCLSRYCQTSFAVTKICNNIQNDNQNN